MIRSLVAAAAALLFALPAAAFVDIEEVQTPAGHQVWLVEAPEIPFVALEIAFRGGTSLDAPDKRGAVNLMAALLEEGAGDMDARAFAAARDDLAARISFGVDDDALSVSARFLTGTAEETASLIRTALTAPRFDPDAVERVRAQVLSGLRQDAEDPDAIATQAFAARAFDDHPYGTPGEGRVDSVASLTEADLRAAHRGAVARDRVVVAAVGDIDAGRLAALVDTILADLPETGAPMPGPAGIGLGGGIEIVEFDTPQSVIQFGQHGLPQDHPDFFAAFVLNQILGGGGFGSRLMDEVREKRGLTYGIYTYIANKDRADVYVGRASTVNARAAETVAVVREEWARMAAEGPTAEELERAKTYLTGAYPLRFDSNRAIAGTLVWMQLAGLPVDYVQTRNDKVAAVTLEDVRRVARDFLDPEALTFVVVGRPEGLAASN